MDQRTGSFNIHLVTSLLIGLLVFVCAASLSSAQEPSGPRIVCEHANFNFGTLDSSQTINHSFQISNAGDGPLSITRVKVCCGARKTHVPEMIPAGGSDTIDISLSIEGKAGKVNKNIYVHSDDDLAPISLLRFMGTVVSLVDVEPSRISFERVSPFVASSANVTISTKAGTNLSITNVVVCDGPFSAKHEERGSNGNWRVSVRTVPPLTEGPLKGRIEVFTDCTVAPNISVLVGGDARPDISAAPRVVETGDSTGGDIVVGLRSRSGTDFKVLKVLADSVDCEFGEKYDGHVATRRAVTISLPADFTPKAHSELVIATDNPEHPNVTIPIRH